MTAEEIRYATQVNYHQNTLIAYVINGWPLTRTETTEEEQPYWPFQDDIGTMEMKGRRIIVPVSLQQRVWGTYTSTTWL